MNRYMISFSDTDRETITLDGADSVDIDSDSFTFRDSSHNNRMVFWLQRSEVLWIDATYNVDVVVTPTDENTVVLNKPVINANWEVETDEDQESRSVSVTNRPD